MIEAPIHAKINGETLNALPQDLYIPPDALEVYLETFEGPLDLLLYLIRKHNLDILDIPMAKLTTQYMGYVEKMKVIKLELAADYLLMSAMLIEIKSRMLLPKPAEVAEEDDPRAELVRRLMEYEAIKLAAQRLDAMPTVGAEIQVASAYYEHISQVKPPEVSLDDLLDAWKNVLKRAKLNQHHKLGRAELSVREHMSQILRRLSAEKMVSFSALFEMDDAALPKLVVHFLAILELAKEGLIRITQQAAFSPIYLQLHTRSGIELNRHSEMRELSNIQEMKQVLEAALLTAAMPLSLDDLLKLFAGKMERTTLRMLLDELKQDWSDKTLDLVQVASGYRFQAKTQYSEYIARLNPDRQPKYSRAVMETLAIIAYRQPVTRGDIEQIRGVAVNPNVIRQLQEREWIDVVGQREVPGRPSLYATTKYFLDDLNLRSLAELPPFEEFAQAEIPLSE